MKRKRKLLSLTLPLVVTFSLLFQSSVNAAGYQDIILQYNQYANGTKPVYVGAGKRYTWEVKGITFLVYYQLKKNGKVIKSGYVDDSFDRVDSGSDKNTSKTGAYYTLHLDCVSPSGTGCRAFGKFQGY